MNKAVLISIQPYYVFLIIARLMGWNISKEKTVEVMKSFPKESAWNRRVHIYCSKNRKSFNRIPKQYQPLMEKFLGKVVGEFVCDGLDRYWWEYWGDVPSSDVDYLYFGAGDDELKKMCLSEEELNAYGKGKPLYGWHIFDLKIYDKPKELREFFVKGDCEEEDLCRTCKYYDRGNEWAEVEPDCTAYGIKPLTRPPQSWCYVQELQNVG